jgi:hypothetical protein
VNTGEISLVVSANEARDCGASAVESDTGVSKKRCACTAACSMVWQQDIEQACIFFMPWPSWPQSIGTSSLFCVAPFCVGR